MNNPANNLRDNSSANATAPQLPVNMERLAEVTDGDQETMRELVELFYRQTAQQLSQMEAALQQGNAGEVRRIAHSCAGASATLGMVRLVPLLRTLEKKGQTGDLAGAPELYQAAAAEFKQIQQFLGGQPALSSIVAP